MLRQVLDLIDIRKFDRNAKLFFAFGVPYFSGMGFFGLLYNLYLLRLGYREDFMGLLAGMTPLAAGTCAFLIGILSDKFGRKPFLIAASLIMVLSQAGLCLTTERWLLLSFGFLAGLSTSMVYVNHVPYLAENSHPRDRGKVISLAFSLQIVTNMLVSLLGGAMPGLMAKLMGVGPDHPSPLRYTLLIGTGVTALSIIPLFSIDENRKTNVSEPPPDQPASYLPSGGITPWGLLIIFGAVSAFRGLSSGLSYPFFNVFFEEERGASATTIGVIFFCARAVSIMGTVVSHRLSRRFGDVATIFPLRLSMAVSLGILGASVNLPLSLLLFSAYFAADSMATPTEMALATDAVSRSYWGRAQSLRVMGFQLLSAGGSILAGIMILRVGYILTFGAAAFLVLGSAIILLTKFGWSYRDTEVGPFLKGRVREGETEKGRNGE